MNDEKRGWLGAYVDGELGAQESQAVRNVLDTDHETRSYVEKIRGLNEALSSAYAPIASEQIPLSIHGVVHRYRKSLVQRVLPFALAASLAVIAVLLIRQVALDDQMQDQLAKIQAQMALLRAQTLENVPSGTVASWSVVPGKARIEVMPVRTYRTADSRFCREYEERVDEGGIVEVRRGIACRSGKAEWADLRSGMM
ncbi:MAG: hypothetical protein KDJ27_08580 [Gammaproteobacteria bacterium]|nr:hypothetical protein [Gammaproteobacteria bacterium]MCB1923787.1 hypothetical protein [Gammaproteobacteria bacterium]